MASLCEAFPGRLPSEIQAEIDQQPAGFLEEILEAKAYRKVKEMRDAADTQEARMRLPKTPLFLLASQIDMDLAAEALKKKTSG